MTSRPLLLVALALLAGCDVRSERETRRWTERQAAVDPPELWRVEAVGSDAPPVQVCADSFLRTGFATPLPEVQGLACTPLGDPIQTDSGRLQRCTLGDQTLLVRTRTEGGPEAFTVDLRVTVLGKGPRASVAQSRRYTRLGPCPKGWKVGDNTDRAGKITNEVWPPAWR